MNNILKIKNIVKQNELVNIKFGEGNEQIEFTINPNLNMKMLNEIVNAITESVVKDDTIYGYNPQFLDFVKKTMIIAFFTNFELPNNIDDIFELINGSDLYEKVINVLNDKVDFNMIFDAADKMIDARVRFIINNCGVNGIIRKINSYLEELTNKIEPKDVENLLAFANKVGKLPEDEIIEALVQNNKKDKEENK